MTTKNRIFLAHAREDKKKVRVLYDALKARGFDPWLDEVDLMPGQIWKDEISKAIRQAQVFLACLSTESVEKRGYVHHEFRLALSALGERPPGSIFFIPVRLDECKVPDLQRPDLGLGVEDIQWVDLWEKDGFERLVAAIKKSLEGDASARADKPGEQEAAQRTETQEACVEPPKDDARAENPQAAKPAGSSRRQNATIGAIPITAKSGSLFRWGVTIAVIALGLDQLSKWVMLALFDLGARPIEVTPFFNLVMVWNRGVSFGMFNSSGALAPWLLSGLALAVVMGLLWWLRRADQHLTGIGLGLVIGGALGNVIDRIRYGAVVDFLDFHVAGYHWPAFNLADAAICIGAGLMLADGLWTPRRQYT